MSLAGMLMGISSDIGNPTQLSEGQKGLFNTLGASLAPMPTVNPDDPASLRAAAAEAMRRGDAQQARIYAVMASERENSVRQKNASGNALLDEGNAEIQSELARKQGLLGARQAAGAYEGFLKAPGLLQSVKRGDMSVNDAMKAQQTINAEAQKEQGRNQRAASKEAGANSRAAMRASQGTDELAKHRQAVAGGLQPGSQEYKDFMLGKQGADIESVRKRIDKRADVDLSRINLARDAYLTILSTDGEAGSSQIALQSLRGMFPSGSRANAEMTAFAKSKSLPGRVADTVSMWLAGDLTSATKEDYKTIARLIHDYERSQAQRGIQLEIDASDLTPEQAEKLKAVTAIEDLPPDFSGMQPVAKDAQGAEVYEYQGKYYYKNGVEYKES